MERKEEKEKKVESRIPPSTFKSGGTSCETQNDWIPLKSVYRERTITCAWNEQRIRGKKKNTWQDNSFSPFQLDSSSKREKFLNYFKIKEYTHGSKQEGSMKIFINRTAAEGKGKQFTQRN